MYPQYGPVTGGGFPPAGDNRPMTHPSAGSVLPPYNNNYQPMPPQPGYSHQSTHGHPDISNHMQAMSLREPPKTYPSSGFNNQNQNMVRPQLNNGVQYHAPINTQPHPTMNQGPLPGGYPPSSATSQPRIDQSSFNQPGPGVPPNPYQPVYQPPASNYPGSFGYQSAQKKLNPDQMPSPVQVMEDDSKNRSGIFCTNEKGLVPPLVTTQFVTQDQGNASPRFIRSTMYNVPVCTDMMKQSAMPFALVISPIARQVEGEMSLPVVNMGNIGPVRCVRCKAYMSPLMQFIDGGRRFHCMLCKATTEVPQEYFQHLDHTGQRIDRYQRPELILGAYEFLATKDYCKNDQPPKIPAMIFVIDVSYNNVKSGLVHLLCANIKQIIQNLPRDAGEEKSRMKVGFITYSTSVHFYNIKSSLTAPQMMVVNDLQDMFVPLVDGFLCDPFESEIVIDQLMNEIPKICSDTRETETILYPAIQAGLEALKATDCAGKLLVFHSSLPIGEAPGKLINREDRKLLGTDKEKHILTPLNTTYTNLAKECVQAGCCVDLFIFNNSFIDLATIGELSKLTGGGIYKYTYFQSDIDGERFLWDLQQNVSRDVAFDAVMRVRTSTGVRATEFYGNICMSNTTDIELAAIDSDKAVGVEVKHDDKLTEEDGVYVQVALLYTSCSGQRRIRILNLSLKTCTQMADMFRSCDLDTLVNYLSKQSLTKLLNSSPKELKDHLIKRCAAILACYRKNCATPSSMGQLILPECMKLLPLYTNSIIKSEAVSGSSSINVDDRYFAMSIVLTMDVRTSVIYFYPRITAIHHIKEASDVLPTVRCTSQKLTDDGVYLVDNGVLMFLFIGMNAPLDFIQNVFGVPTPAHINTEQNCLPALDSSLSVAVRNYIENVREERSRAMKLYLVKQGDKMEVVFKKFLVEDVGIDGSPSYIDFLCQVHNEIRDLLN